MADPQLKLLVATRTSPFAGEGGSGTYVFDVLRYLSTQGFVIRVVWTEPPDLLPSRGWYTPPAGAGQVFSLEIMDLLKVGHRFWKPSVIWLPFKAQLFHFIKTILRTLRLWHRPEPNRNAAPSGPATPSWGEDSTAAEVQAVRGAIARWRPDVVIANYAWMSSTVRDAGASVPRFAVLTHDVRHRQLHLHDGKVFEKLGEHTSVDDERRMLAPADALIAIQQTEAAVFSHLFPEKKIIAAPMSARVQPLPPATESVLLFVGSDHRPNREGLLWFIDNVWPAVVREVPDTCLFIAGGICSTLPVVLPRGIVKLGRVPDLSAAYAKARVVIAPIFQGSGIKIKLLEAIGYGRACITTSVGLEGLEALRAELCVADTAVEFARVTAELLRDPARAAQLGAALQERAQICLSSDACYRPVAGLLRELAAGGGAHP